MINYIAELTCDGCGATFRISSPTTKVRPNAKRGRQMAKEQEGWVHKLKHRGTAHIPKDQDFCAKCKHDGKHKS